MSSKVAASGSAQVCSISFNMTDRLRLIGMPIDLTSHLRNAIKESWGRIQDEREYYGTHEFKLRGNPWEGQGSEAVSSRALVTHILKCMAQNGWNLIQAADVSKKPEDKDTLFFENSNPDPEVDMFSLSFNMHDRIRVIGASSMVTHVREAIKTQWKGKIQKEREYHGSFEFKLAGNLWKADGSETVYVRMLLNQILANFRAVGYKLYASLDISIGNEFQCAVDEKGISIDCTAGFDLESWIFRRVGPCWT